VKIAVIGPVYPYRGGIAHFTSLLSSKLINAGHDTTIISFRRQYPAWLYPGKTDKDPSKPVIKLETKFTLDPIYPWTWIGTVNEIKRINPDLILIAWWTTFWAPGFWTVAKLLTRKHYKVVFLIHNVPGTGGLLEKYCSKELPTSSNLVMNRNACFQSCQALNHYYALIPSITSSLVFPILQKIQRNKSWD